MCNICENTQESLQLVDEKQRFRFFSELNFQKDAINSYC